jgi:aldose 1-epimerase
MTVKLLEPDTLNGAPIARFELRSDAGFSALVSAHGARLLSLSYPDGKDVVVGPSLAAHFIGADAYAGPVCGRVANRLFNAEFMLDGAVHKVAANLGAHQLHGGPNGFNSRVWSAETDGGGVAFSLVSPDGDQGFPGEMHATAHYALAGGTLSCELSAATDKPTIVNLTNHAYWNLGGDPTIAGHWLEMPSKTYCVTENAGMVTGEVRDTAGSPYDFTRGRRLGDALAELPGIDNHFDLDGAPGPLRHAATLVDMASKRRMELHTTEAGVQIYTGNHLGAETRGKHGGPLQRFGAIAMEPQARPDAPNRAGWPSIVLRPGETYRHRIEWRFS